RQRPGWWIGKAWLEQDGVLVETVVNDTPLDLFIEVNGATDERFSFEVLLKDQSHYPVIFIPLGLGLGIAHNL
ncbi:hypothetical protein, partial [Salmonella enterica]|uniref:hypothetical protein n=1 Tax=Salmonella enterica TaxID=28901 RepID=UPI003297A298